MGGAAAARAALADWASVAVAARAHVDDPADPEAAADGRLAGEPSLAALPPALHALAHGPLLEWVTAGGDAASASLAAAAARTWVPRLPPASLAAELYPRLSAWADVETPVAADLPLTATALDSSPRVFLLESGTDVLLARLEGGHDTPWPPPPSSTLWREADAARARTGAARARVLDGPAARAALLAAAADDGGRGGADRWMDAVAADARALLRGAPGVAP